MYIIPKAFPRPVTDYPLIVEAVRDILYRAKLQQRFRQGLAKRMQPPVGK